MAANASRRRSRLLSMLFAGVAGAAPAWAEEACPSSLEGARQLVLVTTAGMARASARLQRFERSGDGAPWRAAGQAEPAVVGSGGLAWGHPFRALARDREPVKTEGDKRTPAGVFKIGRSFGFAPAARPGHLVLKPGETICVDDPVSPAYNAIVPRTAAGAARGEDMGAIDLYRRGLVIDYPTDATRRAGSCIFIRVWRAPGRGTAGCVALAEAGVAGLQKFAQEGAAIAILPANALDHFQGCLPVPQ